MLAGDIAVAVCRGVQDVIQRVTEGTRQVVISLPSEVRIPWRLVEQWTRGGLTVYVVLAAEDEPLRWFLAELGVTSVFHFDEARNHLARIFRCPHPRQAVPPRSLATRTEKSNP